jgi:YHS domain-containing protein
MKLREAQGCEVLKVICPKCGKEGSLSVQKQTYKGKVLYYFSIEHNKHCYFGNYNKLPDELKPIAEKLIQKHNGGGGKEGHVKV